LRAQLVERRLHAFADLAGVDQIVHRGRAGLVRHLIEHVVGFGGLSLRPRSHVINRAVESNPVQPRRKIRPRLEPSKLPIRPHERVLDDVFRILRPAGHAIGQPVDAAAVSLDQSSECVLVAVPRFRDGGHVVRVHLWG